MAEALLLKPNHRNHEEITREENLKDVSSPEKDKLNIVLEICYCDQ